ncbi:MAG: PUR family DNA/RNA-binding protein [Chitinophagales bacterium]|nr:PUR family DNA/RNA-binding protein [Chitinophagales bacterium]MCZ2394802.1 PUR family DNA/RNA-binding protein [Chitinophagales bacterium]
MENEGKHRNDIHSVRLKAGKRRTYFFDIKSTKSNDYFLTITESKKLPNDDFERHKIFIYKEDFVKFVNTLQETVDYIKTELLPDFDFENQHEERDYNNNSSDKNDV